MADVALSSELLGALGRAIRQTAHSHNIEDDRWGVDMPHIVAAVRGGSNCAKDNLARMAHFLLVDQDADWMVNSNHSRDGQREISRNNCVELQDKLCRQRPDWLLQIFGYQPDPENLTTSEAAYLHDGNVTAMTKLIMYGDERLMENNDLIARMRPRFPGKRIFAGVEVNLLPDGTLDTLMVEEREFEFVVLSLHPDVDADGFADLMDDPEAYSRFLAKALGRHPSHILAHPGFQGVLPADRSRLAAGQISPLEAERRYRLNLDWSLIGSHLRVMYKALEINFAPQHKYLCREVMKPENTNWREGWQQMIRQVPIIESADELAGYLRWQFSHGMLLAIDNDAHEVPSPERMAANRDRWDEAMEMLAKEIGQGLVKLGADPEQVINTWSVPQLEQWLGEG